MSISVGTAANRSAQQFVDQSNSASKQKKNTDSPLTSMIKDVTKATTSTAGRVVDIAGRVGSLINTVV